MINKKQTESLSNIRNSLAAFILSQHLILYRTQLLLLRWVASAICQHHLLPIKIQTGNAHQRQWTG